ncbi:MAG: hypothetical protein AAFO82_05770 [Bacteroidota bacterium]
MLTLNTKAVTSNGTLHFSLDNIPEGKYNVLIVLENIGRQILEPLTFENFDFSFEQESLSRSEIYGEDGR